LNAAVEPAIHPDYAHVRRYWDKTRNQWMAKILPGEFYVTGGQELITTVLGSCVSACIVDPKRGVGGMNHFMLPHTEEHQGSWDNPSIDGASRYGSYAMEKLINDILAHGGRRDALEVKLFGGSRVLANLSNVGASNIDFARHYVINENLRLVAEDLGGLHPRKVVFYPSSGRVQIKKLRSLHNDTIIRREVDYMRTIETQPVRGEAELF